MGVDVEEEGCCWVLGDGGIDVARWSRRTGLFELQVPSPVGIDGWPEEVTCIAYLVVVKSNASFEKEKVQGDSQKEGKYQGFTNART